MRRALGLFLFLPTTACSQLLEYPAAEVEQGTKLCTDELDNDFDGVTDCEDLDCDGSCVEESLTECADERDNDGDGLADAEDPRCWPVRPPHAQRCAEASGVEFIETFDVPFLIGYSWSDQAAWPWRAYHGGIWGDIVVSYAHPAPDRQDAVIGFAGNANQNANAIPGPDALERGLGAFVRQVPFAGSWQDFELAFSASVPAGGLLSVAIVPVELAPGADAPALGAEAALVSAAIDTSHSPPTFTLGVEGALYPIDLPSVPACEEEECWARVELVSDSEGIRARLAHPDGTEVEVRGPAPTSPHLPPARLVFRGGTDDDEEPVLALLDDVRLSVKPEQPCGFAAPQIPSEACHAAGDLGAFGHSVSVARGISGDDCALVLAGPAASGPALPLPSALTTWSSTDGGATWNPEAVLDGPRLGLPEDAVLLGGGIARSESGLHAVVTYRENDEVRIAFLDGDDCASWSEPKPGLVLPDDAQAASYVVEKNADAIYFTRPPGELARTLWRWERDASADPELISELPKSVIAPVSVQRVGKHDLVLSFPQPSESGNVGVGLLVADAAGDWQPVDVALPFPPAPDLPEGQGRLAFDDSGVAAATLAFGEGGGYLLYAGRSTTGLVSSERLSGPLLSVGTARFGAAGDAFPETSQVLPSRAPQAVPGDLVEAPDWQLTPDDPDPTVDRYFTSDPLTLNVSALPELEPTWSVLPLDRSVTGDFELSFELFVHGFYPWDQSCSLHVGLASADGALFARVRKQASCVDTYAVTPVVVTGEESVSADPVSTGCIGAQDLPLGTWQHVRLQRRESTLTVAFEGQDACGTREESIEGAFTEPLRELRLGFASAAFGADDLGGCAGQIAAGSLRNITLEQP